MNLRQAAQQALEALEPEWWETGIDVENKQSKAAEALRAALAEPQQDEVRHLHSELERKSNAIQRLWKERDELRALNAELVEALRRCRDMVAHPDNLAFIDAALAKVAASK